MKMYEIPYALRLIEAQIEEAEGVLTPELEAELDGLTEAFERKAEYLAMLVREATLEEAKWKDEEDRVGARRRSFARRAEGLRRYLHSQMEAMGTTKVQGEKLTVAVQRNGAPSVMFRGDVDALPDAFKRVKVEINAQAMREAYKAGEALPEGVEVYHGTHLRIR
jgi:hypothetical protein